jgi:hypothetical protein
MNNELENIWKAAAMAQFYVLSQHFLEILRKTTKTSNREKRCPGQDLNPCPPEYVVVLTTRPRRSVAIHKFCQKRLNVHEIDNIWRKYRPH